MSVAASSPFCMLMARTQGDPALLVAKRQVPAEVLPIETRVRIRGPLTNSRLSAISTYEQLEPLEILCPANPAQVEGGHHGNLYDLYSAAANTPWEGALQVLAIFFSVQDMSVQAHFTCKAPGDTCQCHLAPYTSEYVDDQSKDQ